jgi:arylsulfatase A-like enzyme
MADKPNLLFVFSDQQRASAMGCYYGDEGLETPHFDEFARQGMRLDNAVSSTPLCTTYRSMMMTGLYGQHTGVTTNKVYPNLSEHAHIGQTFKNAGYRCGYVGKWHLGEIQLDSGHPMRLGFDDEWFVPLVSNHSSANRNYAVNSSEIVVGEGSEKPQIETNRAIKFIRGQEGEAPWCMFLSWHPPHPPMVSPEEYVEKYQGRDLKFHPNVRVIDAEMYDRYQGHYANYYGLVAWLDTQWNRLMNALEESDQADNTIVVFTSDHGEMLNSQSYRGKRWPHRESTQIPFLIRWPGLIEANTTLETPFGTPDIFPTLCGLAGIDIPTGLDGSDLSGTILSNDAPHQEYAYMTMHHSFVAWPGWRGVRTAKYNYARMEEGPWVCFDLENDPYERNNLAETNSPVVSELDGLVLDAMKKTGDSWRNINRETGDWQSWLGYKQVKQLESHAEYPGSQAIKNWAVRNKIAHRDAGGSQ